MKITPQDLVLYFGLLLTILNIIDRSSILKEKANSPHREVLKQIAELKGEIAGLKDELDDVKNKLKNDNWRIVHLENSDRVLLKAIGAMLSHSIDGDNIEEMKDARKELNNYLYDSKGGS